MRPPNPVFPAPPPALPPALAPVLDPLGLLEIIIRPLARAIELRDGLTGAHCRSVGELATATAAELGLPESERRLIAIGGLLHDLGKIGVPDRVLRNTDTLRPRERSIIEAHASSGEAIVAELGLVFPEAIEIARMIGAHHEHLDGSGYPRGLVGEAIPQGARIITVADIWSAITMRRSYSAPTTTEQARDILRQLAGSQLDPEVVSAFLKVVAC
jgi:putative nucleotidyltransferase with HDIG domain